MDLLVGSVRRLSESRNKSRSLPLYNKGQPPSLNLAAFQDDGISIASGKSFKIKNKRKRQSLCLPLPSSSNQSTSDDGEIDAEGTTNSDTSCSSVEFLRVPPRKSKEPDESPPKGKPAQSLLSVAEIHPEPSLFIAALDNSSVFEPRNANNLKGTCDSLKRKERLEALKARITADRERFKDSSSEEEVDPNKNIKMLKFKSDETLHRPSTKCAVTTKSRAARTERYLKRKSQDDVSLKHVSRSDPNLEFLDYSSSPWSRDDQGLVHVIEKPPENTPLHDNPKSSLKWQESNLYVEPRRISDVSGYHSQVETYKISASPPQNYQATPKPAPIIRSGFSGPFFPSTRKPSPLTVSTALGSPIHMAHPSPCDSGLSSQSMASSPSLGRAPTPPPRTKLIFSESATHPPSVSCKNQRTGSCALSSLQTASESLYGRVISRSPTLVLQSECTSSGRSSPCWNRVIKPNGNKLPPQSPVKANGKSSFYQYTDVPPFRATSPVVYSYTDQAPTFKVNESYISACMSDSQIDANQRQPNKSVFGYQRKLTTPPPIPSLSHIEFGNNGEILSDSSANRTGIWKSISSSPKTTQPAIAKRPLSMVLEKSESVESNGFLKCKQLAFQNGIKKSPPPVTPRKHTPLKLDISKTVNGNGLKSNDRKNSSSNYEEALQELEDIYQSLGLNDEDLLDRAERRDIPTPHQFKRFSIADPLGAGTNGFPLTRSCSDSVPSPIKNHWSFDAQLRTTTPLRRSAVPDKVTDDLANRRLQRTPSYQKNTKNTEPVMSYLQCSPALTPGLTVDSFFKNIPGKNEPNVELDDVTYRKYTQAEAGRVPPPHPPFGIPLGPLPNSSPNDYLHLSPALEDKPTKLYWKPPQEPDVVRDDMAFRNLRRDRKFSLGAEGALEAACKEVEVWPRMSSSGIKKKERAQRSLSANVESILATDICEGLTEAERAQSMTDLIAELERESRKWESFAQGTDAEEDTKKKYLHGSSTETLTESKVNDSGSIIQTPLPKGNKNQGAIYSLMSDIKPRRRQLSSCETTEASSARDSRSRSPPPVPKRNSMYVLPKRPPHHLDFWSDTEAKHLSPFDDGQIDDLLASLASNKSGLRERPSSMGHEVKGKNSYASVLENDAFKTSQMIHFPSSASSQQNVTNQSKPYSTSALLPNFGKASLAMTETTQRPTLTNFSSKGLSSSSRLNENPISRFGGRSRVSTPETEVKLNSTSSISTDMPSGYASASNERIAKIKEERRKQMQSRFSEASLKSDVSSSDILGSESAFLRRSLRLSKRNYTSDNPESREAPSNEGTSSSASESALSGNGVAPARRRFITREQSDVESSAPSGLVRSTRASRLRAQANSSSLLNNLPTKSAENLVRQDSMRKTLSDGDSANKPSAVDANENITEKSLTQSVPSQLAIETETSLEQEAPLADKVKDKSSKRKSNLNRANFLDEPRPIPSDANEAARKPRRTRRTSESSQTSSLDKSDAAFVRTGSLRVTETSSRFKKSSSDTPNELRANLKRDIDARIGRNSSPVNSKPEDNTPKKTNALRKPEIPEVLRQRINTSPTPTAFSSKLNDVPTPALTESTQTNLSNQIIVEENLKTVQPNLIAAVLDDSKSVKPSLSKQKYVEENTESETSGRQFSSSSSFLLRLSSDSVELLGTPTDLSKQKSVENNSVEAETSRCLFSSGSSSNHLSSDTVAEKYSLSPILDNSNDEIFGTPPETPNRGLSISPTHKETITSVTTEFKSIRDYSSTFTNTQQNPLIELKSFPLEEPSADQIELQNNGDCFSTKLNPIFKRNSIDEDKKDITGILRLAAKEELNDYNKKPSILKKRGSSEEKELSDGIHSILKKHSFDEGSSPVHSILKNHRLSIEEIVPSHKPILKKRSSFEELLSDSPKSEPRPILKKKVSEEESDDKPKPILKSRKSLDDSSGCFEGLGLGSGLISASARLKLGSTDTGIRSILKKSNDCEEIEDLQPFSILRSRAQERQNFDFAHSTPISNRRNSDDIASDSALALFRGAIDKSPKLLLRRNSADSEVFPGASGFKNKLNNFAATTILNKTSEVSESSFVDEEIVKTTASIKTTGTEVVRKGLKVTDGIVPGHSIRERFNRRNVPRYRTQPVTQVEVQQTDCLESVQAFRALIMKKASLNIFDQLQKDTKAPTAPVEAVGPVPAPVEGSKREYPQPYRSERKRKFDKKQERRQNARYRTLPITLEEIHEAEKAERNAQNAEAMSDVTETKDRTSSSSSDELIKLSVSAKASLFQQKVEEVSDSIRRKSGVETPFRKISAKRFLSRSQTQPVTDEEVHEAAKIIKAENEAKNQNEETSIGNDPSKLTLAEKMRLFTEKSKTPVEPEKPLSKVYINRRRSGSSRFRTQPVTTEEVMKASGEKRKSTGLAASFIREDESKDDSCLGFKSFDENSKSKNIVKLTESLSTNFKSKLLDSTPSKPVIAASPKTPVKVVNYKGTTEDQQSSSESSEASSSEEDSENESEENKKNNNKTVLTGGQKHIIINQMTVSNTSPAASRKITNPAVQRKLNASLRHKEERRSLQTSQILEAKTNAEGKRSNEEVVCNKVDNKTKMVLPHSRTLPSLVIEKASPNSPGSIKERLAALQKSGTEDWQKRIMQTKPIVEKDLTSTPVTKPRSNTLPDLPSVDSASSILDLKSKLEESQAQWRQRVEEKDAAQYTVAGKMANSSSATIMSSPNSTPLLERKKKVPKPMAFVSSNQGKEPKIASKVLPTGVRPLSKSKSTPDASRAMSSSESSSEEEVTSTAKGLRVLVPKADNETFSSFFDSVTVNRSEEKLEVSEAGFIEVASYCHELLVQKKPNVKMQKRHPASRNPIKALASRSDLTQEYIEVKSGIAEKEMKRIQIEQLAKQSDKALSALAGLASKEDFKAVALKKSAIEACPLMAHDKKMLIQVKGRRHVQTRLVEPVVKSLNTGDSYVLVTQDKVYCYIGEYSNVIERAKVSEIASVIQLKKDAGFKGTSDVITLDNEKNPNEDHLKKFFELLEGDKKEPQPAGLPEEDEVYEKTIIGTNKVYSMEGDVLVPCKEAWGELPRIEMLIADQIYIFDFGSELYVWMGKQVPLTQKKSAARLSRELWDTGYDYSDCDMNPLCPKLETEEETSNFPSKSSSRPLWAKIVQVRQHMEPVLFREKFLDWPDLSRVIKVKGLDGNEENNKVEPTAELKAFDAKAMLSWIPKEPDLELDGSHLGRGQEYYDHLERRNYEITTISLAVWHILEYGHNLLVTESYGQFHSGDTYVVRWHYMLTQIGRDFHGKLSKHSFTGRNRCTYFFWQGKDSSITEKGASALMTVELDEERGPHVRVVQGREPPCFLNLFEGHMIIYRGKREEEETNTLGPWKLFAVLGELASEAFLLEVNSCCKSLRSLKSFVLVNINTGRIFVWHGVKSSPQTREAADETVKQLTEKRPQEMIFNADLQMFEIITLEEGKESSEFWNALGGKKRKQYFSLLRSSLTFLNTPRLFFLTSVSGVFSASEVVCSFFTTKHHCFLPFQQTELYSASQPALFLLDNDTEVYLWQGWMPQGNVDSDNVATGSAAHRWSVNRRCAMETTLQYCQEKNSDNPPNAYLVSAGSEPLYFTNLFPEWEDNQMVVSLKLQSSSKDSLLLVKDILAKLHRTHFSLEELQAQPLPEGVDPSRLESYLSEEDFYNVLGVKKTDFYTLPNWRQKELKKKAQLF